MRASGCAIVGERVEQQPYVGRFLQLATSQDKMFSGLEVLAVTKALSTESRFSLRLSCRVCLGSRL